VADETFMPTLFPDWVPPMAATLTRERFENDSYPSFVAAVVPLPRGRDE
jgi:hypothetical protein